MLMSNLLPIIITLLPLLIGVSVGAVIGHIFARLMFQKRR